MFLDDLLPHLTAPRYPGLGLGQGMVYPAYDGLSLLNLPASICAWLGLQGQGIAPLQPRLHEALGTHFKRVVLVLVDGLGLERARRAVADSSLSPWSGLVQDGFFAPLTSVSPSTTVAALTTLWTGASPARHGLAGYELWLKEYGLVANMIFHSPSSFVGDTGGLRRAGFDPQTFLPVQPFGSHLARQSARVEAFMHQAIARSGLSAMHLPDTGVYPFRTLADMLVSLGERLERPPDGPEYLYAYWGDIDELSHRFGPDDRRVEREFEQFSALFEREVLRRVSPRGETLLLVTADHGLIETPRRPELDLRNHPELTRRLHIPPSGENRLAYLHIRPGEVEAVEHYLAETWPGQFDVIDSARLIESGLFGPDPSLDLLRDRLGDLAVFARGDAYLWWARRENPLLGRHGGLSPQEMLVPLAGWVL